MPQLVLAVDTQIVMRGCKMASEKPNPSHCNLLNSFHDRARLALDKHTRQEYDDNMGSQSEGQAWLRQLATKDRIQFYQSVPREKRSTKVALAKIRFSKKDLKFVRLALATDSKCLVAEEPHFVNVQALLKSEEGLLIHHSQAACELIEASLS